MVSARPPNARQPSRPRTRWLVIGLTAVALWGYWGLSPGSEPNAELSREPDVERAAIGGSMRRVRARCSARDVDPELLQRMLTRLASARSDTRRCAAMIQLAAVAADNDVPAAEIARYTRRTYGTDVRTCAVEALGACRSPGALERLLELSEEADSSLRFEVAWALAARMDDAALARVLALADRPGSPWRVPACVALAEVGAPEALDAIAAALDDVVASERQALIAALGATRDPRAIELLKGALAAASHGVDGAVIAALGVHGSPEATRVLMQLLQRRPSRAYAVLRALATSKDPSARQLLLSAAEGRDVHIDTEQALAALSLSADPDVRALMRSGLAHASQWRRKAAIEYFSEYPDAEAVPALLALAHDASASGDRSVLRALGNSGSSEAADALEELALNEDGEGRGEALGALAAMPDQRERARDLALELSERDPATAVVVLERLDPGDSPQAHAALLAMARLPGFAGERATELLSSRTDADTERVLAQLARSADAPHRGEALLALGKNGSESGAAVVREVLRSGDSEARRSAVAALGGGLGAKAEADLLTASHDREPEVAATAVEQLASIATPAALARLEELVDSPNAAIVSRALSAVASEAPERVAATVDRIMASANADTLLGAVSVASYLDPAPRTQLVERALRHSSSDVVVAAIDQLVEITDGGDALTARLGQLANDQALPSEARDYAREALENHGE
jgi:HEAT repeat protein